MHTPVTNRFLSLDVLRGMTVCFMIIVNTPGYGSEPFAPFVHAKWHGFTPTDLVFPTFLFVVGAALSFSAVKYAEVSGKRYAALIARRTALIFLLGYLMYWFPFVSFSGPEGLHILPFRSTRVFGVLQRIALCYFVAAFTVRFLPKRWNIILCLLYLSGYWLLLLIYGNTSDPLGINSNAVYKLDSFLLGDSHLYHGRSGTAFDPEGLLSTLPAIVNVVAGYYTGKYLRTKGTGYKNTTMLLLTGNVLIIAALAWNVWFPVNKKLWTSSFVCLTVGLDLIILAFLVYILDIQNKRGWSRFFIPFGRNPLFIYLISELLVSLLATIRVADGTSLYNGICSYLFNYVPGGWGSLLFAVSYMMVCWIVAYTLDKKKVYIRV